MLAQTEIERVKFVVRSYVRTRLSKVSRFLFHMCLITDLRQIEDYARWISSNPSLHERLSETELKHAQGYAKHSPPILHSLTIIQLRRPASHPSGRICIKSAT